MAKVLAWLAGAVLLCASLPGEADVRSADAVAAAGRDAAALPRPAELERDVRFWIRVYSEVTTNEGFLHDQYNLGVVYHTLRFTPGSTPRERRELVDEQRERYRAMLRRLAQGATELTEEERRIREAFGSEASPARFTQAVEDIRFQLGQADRFRAGLQRSGAWEQHIGETLARLGLPPEIAALPHVESSFDPSAYSKVGAAGLWQFMRATGRRFLRIDDAVDERMDPFRATEAAGQLLDFNYRLLGSWPLALTAYNHGAAGMARAKEAMGTTDIVRIVRHYRSPSFGFASRNFYVSFLAALEIDQHPEKYFGEIRRQPALNFAEVPMPAFVPVSAVERALKLDRRQLEDLNPGLRPTVWKGQRHLPRGYRLRLPAEAGHWTAETLAARLAPAELYAGQPQPRTIRVRKGDTLQGIARARGVDMDELASLNRLGPRARLVVGRTLLLPESEAPSAPVPAAEVAEASVVVKRGDSLREISRRSGVPVPTLVALNELRDPDSIYEGQRLRLSAREAPSADALVAAVTASPKTGKAAEALLSEHRAESQAADSAEATGPREEPVSAAQSASEGGAVPQASDPVDYSVAADGSVRVAAAETLGHFADWLGVGASRLRSLNGLRASRAVVIGSRLKLDFTRVGREAFEQKRREYHARLQAAFFANHRISGTETYTARRGDSLWAVTQRFENLPVWLLQQYNAGLDFRDLRTGTRIVVPRVEQLAGL